MNTPRTFRLRPATPHDIPGLLRCLRSAFEPYRPQYSAGAFVDTTLTPKAARHRLRTMTVLVAHDVSGQIRGTIAWAAESATTAHLRGMAVEPNWQGSGVAHALLSLALEQVREARFRRVTLDTTLPLQRAIKFYQRNGFHPTGRVTDYFGMPLHEYARDLEEG